MLASGAPSAAISACTASSLRTVRPSRITSAPAVASASATARPMPEPAPVTRMTRPANSCGAGWCRRGSKVVVFMSGSSSGRVARLVRFERCRREGSYRLFDLVDRFDGGIGRGAQLGKLARLWHHVAFHGPHGGIEGFDCVAERASHLLQMVHEHVEPLVKILAELADLACIFC